MTDPSSEFIYRVARHGDNWAVLCGSDITPVSLHESQDEAISRARELAQASRGILELSDAVVAR